MIKIRIKEIYIIINSKVNNKISLLIFFITHSPFILLLLILLYIQICFLFLFYKITKILKINLCQILINNQNVFLLLKKKETRNFWLLILFSHRYHHIYLHLILHLRTYHLIIVLLRCHLFLHHLLHLHHYYHCWIQNQTLDLL